jgi:hypothetical protein
MGGLMSWFRTLMQISKAFVTGISRWKTPSIRLAEQLRQSCHVDGDAADVNE